MNYAIRAKQKFLLSVLNLLAVNLIERNPPSTSPKYDDNDDVSDVSDEQDQKVSLAVSTLQV